MLRSDLSMSGQIKAVARSCFYNIRQWRAVKSSLTRDALRNVAYALILPRIDYCNPLYAGLPAAMIQRLQGLISTADSHIWPLSIHSGIRLHQKRPSLAASRSAYTVETLKNCVQGNPWSCTGLHQQPYHVAIIIISYKHTHELEKC